MFRLTLPSLRFAVFVFLVLSFLVFTPHSIAQESDVVVPQYNPVAAEYAKMLSVSYDDAVERLDM